MIQNLKTKLCLVVLMGLVSAGSARAVTPEEAFAEIGIDAKKMTLIAQLYSNGTGGER